MKIDDLIRDLQLKKTYLQRESDIMSMTQEHIGNKRIKVKELYEKKLDNYLRQQEISRKLTFYRNLRRAFSNVVYDKETRQR